MIWGTGDENQKLLVKVPNHPHMPLREPANTGVAVAEREVERV